MFYCGLHKRKHRWICPPCYQDFPDTLQKENKRLQKQWSDLVDPFLDYKSEKMRVAVIDEIKRNKEIVEKIEKLMKNDGQLCVRCHGVTGKELKEILAKKTKEGN